MIKVIEYTKKPIQLIGRCVGGCYGSDTSDDAKNYKRGLNCIKDGHGRVLEYADVTLEIDDYSIKVIRQLYTHLIGLTKTQESTRYVNMAERGNVVPPSIQADERALKLFEMHQQMTESTYNDLLMLGIPKEDASCILPLSTKTKICLKINARALLNMAQVRMCTRAYWEFRVLMIELKEVIGRLDDEWKLIADMMQPKCEVLGYCTESKSCGRKPKRD